MNKNKDWRNKDFESMLRKFLKESDSKQSEVAHRDNKNGGAKRKKHKKHFEPRTEDI